MNIEKTENKYLWIYNKEFEEGDNSLYPKTSTNRICQDTMTNASSEKLPIHFQLAEFPRFQYIYPMTQTWINLV